MPVFWQQKVKYSNQIYFFMTISGLLNCNYIFQQSIKITTFDNNRTIYTAKWVLRFAALAKLFTISSKGIWTSRWIASFDSPVNRSCPIDARRNVFTRFIAEKLLSAHYMQILFIQIKKIFFNFSGFRGGSGPPVPPPPWLRHWSSDLSNCLRVFHARTITLIWKKFQ